MRPAARHFADSFRAIGTTVEILTTREDTLAPAMDIARQRLAELDAALSRFRPDSEVCRLAAAAAQAPASARVSQTFANHLRAALRMARFTEGLVDPTIGSAVVASGYDADMDVIRSRATNPHAASASATTSRAAAAVPRPDAQATSGWQAITIDPRTDEVSTPAGILLDFGATAKAHAADLIAAELGRRHPGGFLVNLGGDIAIAGESPVGGWPVGVEDAHGATVQVVALLDGYAVATSSTRLRTWAATDGTTRHHIVDPRTGRTAPTTWAQVTCVAPTALKANAATTAAIVLGPDAPAWLERHGIPARLDGTDGTLTTTSGWPAPTSAEVAA